MIMARTVASSTPICLDWNCPAGAPSLSRRLRQEPALSDRPTGGVEWVGILNSIPNDAQNDQSTIAQFLN